MNDPDVAVTQAIYYAQRLEREYGPWAARGAWAVVAQREARLARLHPVGLEHDIAVRGERTARERSLR